MLHHWASEHEPSSVILSSHEFLVLLWYLWQDVWLSCKAFGWLIQWRWVEEETFKVLSFCIVITPYTAQEERHLGKNCPIEVRGASAKDDGSGKAQAPDPLETPAHPQLLQLWTCPRIIFQVQLQLNSGDPCRGRSSKMCPHSYPVSPSRSPSSFPTLRRRKYQPTPNTSSPNRNTYILSH